MARGSGSHPAFLLLFTFSLALVGLLYPTVSLGQAKDSTRQELAMEEVVITAQHAPISASASTYQVRVIDRNRIDAQAAQSLPDLLQSELGVQLIQDPALGTQIQLQGLGGQHVKILVDGVPVIGRLDGEIDLSQLPLNQVERIEIIEGPLSVEYGTNAMGGVINLITKKTTEERFQGQLKWHEASVGPGWSVYDGIHNQDLDLRWRVGKHQIGVSGGRYFFGGSFAEKALRAKSWNPKRQEFASASYRWTGAKGHVQAQSQVFDEYLLRLDSVQGLYQVRALDEHFQSVRQQHQLQGRYAWNEQNHYEGFVAYSRFDRLRTRHLVDMATLASTTLEGGSEEAFIGWAARGTFTHRASDMPLSAHVGYDLNREETRGDKIFGQSQVQHDLAAFLSLEYQPLPSLTLRPGVRATYNDRYPAPLTPSVHLRFAPSGNWTWRASYAKGFRAPTLKELYLEFVDVNHNLVGNQALQAERGHYFQASAQWQKLVGSQLWRVNTQTFYNQVQDQIELTFTGGSDNAYTYFNLAEVQLAGIRTELMYRRERILLQAGVNILGRTSPGLSWLTSAQLQGRIQADLFAGIQAHLFYKYSGPAQAYRDIGTSENPELILTSLDGYHWADLSLQRKFLADKILLGIGGRNLLNVTAVNADGGGGGGAHSGGDGGTAIALGRSLFVSMAYSFQSRS